MHYEKGKKQRERDDKLRMSMNTHLAKIPGKGEKNEHPSAWIMRHDVVGYVSTFPRIFNCANSVKANIELDKTFGICGIVPEV